MLAEHVLVGKEASFAIFLEDCTIDPAVAVVIGKLGVLELRV